MKESIEDKENKSLSMTYNECKNVGDIDLEKDGEKICYFCPKCLTNTEDAFNLIEQFISTAKSFQFIKGEN